MNSVMFGFDFRAPSTWRGLVWITASVVTSVAAVVLPGLSAGQVQAIFAAAAAVVGALGTFTKDKPAD